MSEQVVIAIIVSLLGGGGLGGVIVSAISNRKKIAADCVATLSEAYETRISASNKRTDELCAKVDALETQISGLRTVLSDREAFILNLEQENADLQTQVDKLQTAVKGRDKRIRELERQVAELTARIDAMNGDCDAE